MTLVTSFVIVIASHHRQAVLACERLKLPMPSRTVDGTHVVAIVDADGVNRIRGTLPQRVVCAYPVLDRADRWRPEAVEIAKMRLARADADAVVESVWT